MPLNTGTVVNRYQENLMVDWLPHGFPTEGEGASQVIGLSGLLDNSSLEVHYKAQRRPREKAIVTCPVLCTALTSSNAEFHWAIVRTGLSIVHNICVHLTCSYRSPSTSMNPESGEMQKGVVESRSAGCGKSLLCPQSPLDYVLYIHSGKVTP